MGFFGTVGQRVRNLLQWDKEKIAVTLSKGATGSASPQSGLDLLQSGNNDQVSEFLRLEQDLLSKYVDLEEMDDYPETSTALNLFADDATTTDPLTNKVVWADSNDRTVKEVITDLFDVRLRLDEDAWPMARCLSKYGQVLSEALVTNDGLVGLTDLPPPTMRRIEGRRGELYGFIQDTKGRFAYTPEEFKQLLANRVGTNGGNAAQGDQMTAFEDWEVVHSRLRSKNRRSMYGSSVLDSSRWIWKRLSLLEDSSLMYRLERAAQRYVFYIDTGDMPPKEAYAYLNKVRQQYKKTKFYNPTTGKLDLKYNPLGQMEDIFMSVRKNSDGSQSQNKIDVLNSPSWQSMVDIEYFRLKLFGSIGVPKLYLGYEESQGKSSASQADVRFGKSVLRIQRELRDGFRKMVRIHLAALNINPAAVDYEIYMTVPSSIFELAQMEVRNAKADFAGRMSQFVSLHWILNKVFGLSDNEIEYIIKQRHTEQLADAEIQAKAMGMSAETQGDVQIGQAMKQQQLGMGAAPGGSRSEHINDAQSLSQIWPYRRQVLGYKSITERELFSGNRDHEKKIEDNFEKMFKENNVLARKMQDVKDLVHELRLTQPRFK